jgi:hypothetical protein
VRVEEFTGPATRRRKHFRPNRDGALPQRSCRTRRRRITHAQPRNPTPRCSPPSGIHHAWLKQTQLRICLEASSYFCKKAGVRKFGIVIEKKQKVTVYLRNPSISASWDTHVFSKSQCAHPIGQINRFPAITDNHDVAGHVLLSEY